MRTPSLLIIVSSLVLHAEARADFLSPDGRSLILERLHASYDADNGGFSRDKKTVDPLSTELAIISAEGGSDELAAMAQKTLLKNLQLIDPVWGGAYDYSRPVQRNPWRAPVHSKSAVTEAEELRLYVLAWSMWGAKEYMEAARAIQSYVEAFLTSPEGAFYAGQAASVPGSIGEDAYFKLADQERRRLGVPEIDRRIVTRENGLLVTALARLFETTGDKEAIDRAVRAAEWIIAHRKLPGGGFKSDEDDAQGPRLADSVAMGQASIELYAATGDEKWLAEAEDAAFFVGRTFASEGSGFTSRLIDPESSSELTIDPEENVALTRFANLLHHYTGQATYKRLSEHAMRYLASEQVADSAHPSAGILIANDELARNPVQVIIVGRRNDPIAQKLQLAALAHPTTYRVLEWAEPGPAPLRYHYLDYPRPDRAAAIACEDEGCTPPAFKIAEVRASLRQLAHQ
jgi:uncharacterized protein YyaL (SSP411 family)